MHFFFSAFDLCMNIYMCNFAIYVTLTHVHVYKYIVYKTGKFFYPLKCFFCGTCSTIFPLQQHTDPQSPQNMYM